MPHVVTQACCGDASCVFACPVNCIHPTPDEPDFGTAEMLYIDPASCVDCGACVGACPVGAISPGRALTPEQLPFVEINALFHAEGPSGEFRPGEVRERPVQAPVPAVVRADPDREPLRVAIAGSGPAALYAADELLKQPGAEVTVLERLERPYGLVKAGVAPDHPKTRSVERLLGRIDTQPGFTYRFGVEVGRDVSHEELLETHHAVLYATGASQDRDLGIPGEQLPGSTTATRFVAWYNGHPDARGARFALDTERVVVVGNGNVALDVARILLTDPDLLADTDIDHDALAALRSSRVREVVLVARRGAAQAAFTLPELVGLMARDDLDLRVDGDLHLDPATVAARADGSLDLLAAHELSLLESLADRPPRPDARRLVLRFAASPVEVVADADGRAAGLVVADNEVVEEDGRVVARPTGRTTLLEAGLVLRSIGYHGVALPGLPFDPRSGTVPHEAGAVRADGPSGPVRGAYVAGWIKRGPSGYIGTNKSDAQETVETLVRDFNAGLLTAPPRAGASDLTTVQERGWRRLRSRAWSPTSRARRSPTP